MTSLLVLALLLSTQGAPATQPRPVDSATLDAIAIQVALDRAGFSSGVIDGRTGANTKKALEAYRKREGRDIAAVADPLLEYRITDADAAGPFSTAIPKDLVEQSKLPALDYSSVDEALAERFHTTPAVLRRLNPTASFAAGEAIAVPNVEPTHLPAPTPASSSPRDNASTAKAVGTAGRPDRAAVVVTVSRSASTLSVTDASGRVVFFAPVTTGSENDPLPIGEWKVNGTQLNPSFRYNPELFWDADPSHTKATIPPGPNGPVGVAWIDISKEHYGLHGTPEPASIGRTQSHGCVRLTNWDVLRLASLVGPGTKVVFEE
jgi:lipoprotein-anchoring transpeptidase ErfK/SrfK